MIQYDMLRPSEQSRFFFELYEKGSGRIYIALEQNYKCIICPFYVN